VIAQTVLLLVTKMTTTVDIDDYKYGDLITVLSLAEENEF
jgi:galactitol-specific phosphotransferase system IIC component